MPASREILAHLRSSVYLRLRSHQVDLVNLPRNRICAQLLHRCGTRGLLFRPISGQKAVLRMLQLTICLLLYVHLLRLVHIHIQLVSYPILNQVFRDFEKSDV